MILDKAEQIARSEEKWSLEEVMYMADITKDMSETLKNLAKTNYYLSEHSIKFALMPFCVFQLRESQAEPLTSSPAYRS